MKLLVIDSNSIINRAFYGIKLLTTKDGRFTNAIYGFMNILLKLIDEQRPDGIVAAFDLKAPTFRHKMYDGYKAGRKGMPPELAEQVPVMKNILRMMGISVIEHEGYEADDILGTLSRIASESGGECVIATGDRDSLQLVCDNVRVLLAATKMGRPEVTVYDTQKIEEVYGVQPEALIDVKALMGDSSDNIPGVAGVGEKTALSLITKFGSLDGVYENINSPDIKAGVRAKLEKDKANAYMSKELGTINLDVPMSKNIEDYYLKNRDKNGLAGIFADLEMFRIIERMGLSDVAPAAKDEDETVEVQILKRAESAQVILDSEVVDFVFDEENGVISDGKSVFCMPSDQAAEIIGNRRIRVADSKAFYHRYPDSQANIIFDSSLAGYLLSPSASGYDLDRLVMEYGAVPAVINGEKESRCARLTAVCDILTKKISESGQMSLLCDIEIPLARVLASMEDYGFEVDKDGLYKFGVDLEKQIDEIVSTIYDLVGYQFNLNSPKQLSEALFVKLGLPAGKKTKSGYSTSAEVLESLKDAHPAVSLLLEYRQLAKLKSTYCDGLLKAVGEDGRIHSTLNQTETRTGRISSTEPNLQNIPVRTEIGKNMRKFFTAPKGRLLCDADYSQIELRVLAHISQDKAMTESFIKDEDIHSRTAARVFGVAENDVTPLMRGRAKAVNFGIVYGIGAFSLAKDIGVPFGEAKKYIESYMNEYSGVSRYMEDVVKKAKETGYVQTIYGRRRYLPELSSSNGVTRAFGERVARNAPVQGTAADIIKIAMIRVFNRLRNEKLDAKLILQIHDELIVEASEADAQKAASILSEEMENACKLSVPMPADVHVGRTWFDAKE